MALILYTCVLIGLLAQALAVTYSPREASKQQLFEDLFKPYNEDVDPGNIVLKFGVSLIWAKIDVKHGELSSFVWQRYSWTDSRLRWNPKDYDGIENIRVPSEMLWTPDVELYNTLDADVDSIDGNTVLSSSGEVIWIPQFKHKTLCKKSTEKHHIWNCKLKFGSWTYDSIQIDLQKFDDGSFDLSNYDEDAYDWKVGAFDIAVHKKKYPCCPEQYSSMEIDFEMEHQ